MAFVRVSRDKRGYEHIYLIDATARRGKTSRPRVLYWFRTPPGVTVGREPFDESVRRMLEAKYPDVAFDWEQFRKAAIAAPEVEPWRERRRVERATKQARHAGDRDEIEAGPQPEVLEAPEVLAVLEVSTVLEVPKILEVSTVLGDPEARRAASQAPPECLEPVEGFPARDRFEAEEPFEPREPGKPLEPLQHSDRLEMPGEGAPVQGVPFGSSPPQIEQRRRRRRGGRRRRQSSGSEGTSSPAPSKAPAKDDPAG